MSESSAPADVRGPASQLAELLRADKQFLDRAEFQAGDRLLAFFQDPNYGPSFKGLKALKLEVIAQAIDDMANRARVLSNSFLGVAFNSNRLGLFISDYGKVPAGSVVYKIGLRDVAAFQKWRSGQKSEITAQDLHSAIYRLTVEWSQLL